MNLNFLNDKLQSIQYLLAASTSIIVILIFISTYDLVGSFKHHPIDLGNHHVVYTNRGLQTINLAEWHLFGRYNINLENLPTTNIDASLEGTLVSNNRYDAKAIISISGGKPKSYSIGSEIEPGVVLRHILAGRVIINRNGHLESLFLPVYKYE